MNKHKDRAFKKNVYLLGEDNEGIAYWLEAPSWDCSWYWGFGYIETYTNNKQPSDARDIDSHQHADGKFQGEGDDTNIFTGDFLVSKTFTEKEGWILRELMTTFYHLKEHAEFTGRGGMHITNNPLNKLFKNKRTAKRINDKLIPEVTKQILDILTGDNY